MNRIPVRNGRMLRLIFLSIWIFLMSVPGAALAASEENVYASGGILNLEEWDFRRQGTVLLQGEWEFYWNKLYEPTGLEEGPLPGRSYAMVPHVWKPSNQAAPEREGAATYRIIIILDQTEAGRLKSLYIRNAATAYRLWWNGELLLENGRVGLRPEEMWPKNYAKSASFVPKAGANELVIQVSNFVQRKGGLWDPIEFGDVDDISSSKENKAASQSFIATALLTLGLYHFALFVLRKRDQLSLLVGGYCLLIAIRTLLLGDTLLIRFMPSIDWEWAVKLEYLGFYLGAPFFSMFLNKLFPKEVNRKVMRAICGISLAFSGIVMLFPARVFTYTMLYYELFLGAAIVYLFYVVVLAAIRNRTGARLCASSAVVMIITVGHDVLYYNHFISGYDLAPYGVLMFFFAQTLIVAQKFSKAYEDVELLSAELGEINHKLEEKIQERTKALEISNDYLVYANEHLNRVENSRRELIANITHELGTPMTSIQGYMKALLDGIVQPDKQYIQIIYDKLQTAERLVQDLFDLTKLEEGQTSFHLVDVIVDELFEEHLSKFEWDVLTHGVRFELMKPECPEELLAIVRIDPIRIRQVLSNLINNALNYTAPGGSVSIRGSYEDERLIVTVTDTGRGIDPDVLPYIFDRFVKGTAPRLNAKDGSGLGLAIAKEIVLHHGGIMTASSEQGKGSTFRFDLPVEFIPMVVD
jgi:signal transduction histidine kinase